MMFRFHSISCVVAFCMFVGSSFDLMTTAFSTELPSSSTNGKNNKNWGRGWREQASAAASSIPHSSTSTSLTMAAADGNDDAERTSGNPAIELSSTLARLDRQFQIQQRDKPGSRWTKLVLEPEDNDNDDNDGAQEAPINPMYPNQQQEDDFVYLLEPPNKSNPSCIICFTGGAGLGSFPQVAYNEFLLRLSNRLNAAILTAPYNVGLDHFALAKSVGELHRRALMACQDDPSRLYSETLPTYCVAHSLGCKLATIYMAATGQEYDGVALMSFNNFGFGQTIGMAREFTQQIRQSSMGGGGGSGTAAGGGGGGGFGGVGGGFESFVGNAVSGDTMDSIFNFAQSLLGSIGIEFSPNPSDTERLISLRYAPERQAKTRMFVFDDDTLDSTPSFLQACRSGGDRRRSASSSAVTDDDAAEANDSNVAADDKDMDTVQVSALPGTHLTPVYFKLGLEEIIEDQEARSVARELALERGIPEAASFGNEQEMNALIDEVCGFILGKPPTRPSRPLLSTSSTATTAGGGTNESS